MSFEFFRREDPDKIRYIRRKKLKTKPVGPEGPVVVWPMESEGVTLSMVKPIRPPTKKEKDEALKKIIDEEKRVGHPDD